MHKPKCHNCCHEPHDHRQFKCIPCPAHVTRNPVAIAAVEKIERDFIERTHPFDQNSVRIGDVAVEVLSDDAAVDSVAANLPGMNDVVLVQRTPAVAPYLSATSCLPTLHAIKQKQDREKLALKWLGAVAGVWLRLRRLWR